MDHSDVVAAPREPKPEPDAPAEGAPTVRRPEPGAEPGGEPAVQGALAGPALEPGAEPAGDGPVGPSGTAPAAPPAAVPPGAAEDPVPIDRWTARIITAGAVLACVLFIWLQLQPSLLLSKAVPAGGDMGAHVWGPAYLRDHLLGDLRLQGWAPDWYAGFPAYQFYMVVPALFIVALDVLLPYAVAFKLISVAGVVAMPVAAAAMGRLFRLPFPGPVLLATATVPFLFDTTFTIYGGNIASTLAGEFAFAISLALLLVYLGFLARGLETGRHRALTAVLFALVATCHPIPLLGLASVATAALVGWHVVAAARSERPGRAVRSTLWWVISSLGVGSALSAFWILPFLARGDYLNDMGWERLPTDGRSMLMYLLHVGNTSQPWEGWDGDLLRTVPVLWGVVVMLAAVGAVASWARLERLGCVLSVAGLGLALLFRFLPQGRLWNARLLPFFYLVLYFLAALGVLALARLLRSLPARAAVAVAVVTAVLMAVALPLGTLAGSRRTPDGRWEFAGLRTKESFVKSWARWNYTGYEGKSTYREYYDVVEAMGRLGRERGCGRALWEYEQTRLNGYGTPMALMLLPHWTDGCIGSMEGLFFEASATTPYHFLMQSLLSSRPSRPQRGLPYRNFDIDLGVRQLQLMGVRYYLAFTEQAVNAARAHQELREVARVGGDPVREQQLRAGTPDQAQLDRTLPWVVFEVAQAPLVEPLENLPVVLDDVGQNQHSWLPVAAAFFNDPARWTTFPAATGRPDWPRASAAEGTLPSQPVPHPAEVSGIETSRERISFRVDADSIGSPVLVKTSYFPNWQVDGALGPYRVMPNLMVVVPTSTEVTLSYGDTPVDYLAWAVTLLGAAGLLVLARRSALRVARPGAEADDGRGGDWLAEHRGGTVGWLWAASEQPLSGPPALGPGGGTNGSPALPPAGAASGPSPPQASATGAGPTPPHRSPGDSVDWTDRDAVDEPG